MDKCWKQQCICYFAWAPVKKYKLKLYIMTLVIPELFNINVRIWIKVLKFSKNQTEENVDCSVFKNSENVK